MEQVRGGPRAGLCGATLVGEAALGAVALTSLVTGVGEGDSALNWRRSQTRQSKILSSPRQGCLSGLRIRALSRPGCPHVCCVTVWSVPADGAPCGHGKQEEARLEMGIRGVCSVGGGQMLRRPAHGP